MGKAASAEMILQRWEKMKTRRAMWERSWQDIKDLVRPGSPSISGYHTEGGDETLLIFDGTAPWSNEQLASGLDSSLTPSSDRWFILTVQDEELMNDPDVLLWLDQVTDIIFHCYRSPKSKFTTSMHEGYLDIGAFGTTVVFQDEHPKTGRPRLRTFPLAACWTMENSQGEVDTVYRKECFTIRQCIQEFGQDALPGKWFTGGNVDYEKNVDVLHCVYPRGDFQPGKVGKENMRFASVWLIIDERIIVSESGFKSNPYHVGRWTKIAGESYGRSPAHNCLSSIRLVNEMKKTMLEAAQKAVDPPLQVPDDGFVLPIDTSPASLIFKTGPDPIEPLQSNNNFTIGQDSIEAEQTHIMRSFFVDYIVRPKKKERQTRLEIADDRDEQTKLMSPMLGRLQTELIGPIIERSYQILDDNGLIPPAPGVLEGQVLKIEYMSPAARAQEATKAINIGQFMQDMIPAAQIDPTVFDVVNWENYANELAKYRTVPRSILNTPEQVAMLKDARAKQQQLQMISEAAPQMADAVKSIAQAEALGKGRAA